MLSRFRPYTIGFPPIKQPLALEAEAARFFVPQENGARKRRKFSYVLPITLVGFVGSDPEQFTVLSVATQRSWKNADDEWSSKTEWHRVVVIWNLRERQPAVARSCLFDVTGCGILKIPEVQQQYYPRRAGSSTAIL
jgi:hypothetical protein